MSPKHPRFLGPFEFAAIMAVVAVLGAVAAYCAARAEQASLASERRLQQGQLLELERREQVLSVRGYGNHYADRRDLSAAELKALKAESSALPADDPRQARLHLRTQDIVATRGAFWPLVNYFAVNSDMTEGEILKDAARAVREYGFDVEWVDTPDGQVPVSIWHRMEAQLEEEHQAVRWIAMAVVLFVTALASLTFAQLARRWTTLVRLLVLTGSGLALAAFVLVNLADRRAWLPYLVSLLALAVLAPLGYRFAQHFDLAEQPPEDEIAHGGEVAEGKSFVGGRMAGLHGHGRLSRITISLIAITAITSAGSGYLYSLSATAASSHGAEATGHQADLLRHSARLAADLYDKVVTLGTLSEDLLRLDEAKQRVVLSQGMPTLVNSADAAEMQAAATRDRATHQARAFDKPEVFGKIETIDEVFQGPLGPRNDPDFPVKFVNRQLVWQKGIDYALWDAGSEASMRAQRRATVYLGTLTLFAVALYLFGQSLGMGTTRAGLLLVFVGSCLVIAGIVMPTITALRTATPRLRIADGACAEGRPPNATAASEAARHFADGRMLLALDQAEAAAVRFQCALDQRPNFGLANDYLSTATTSANSPQRTEGAYISLIGFNALETVHQAHMDALEALEEQELRPSSAKLSTTAFDTFLLALWKRDPSLIGDAFSFIQRAVVDGGGTDAVTVFNLGLIQLAAGNDAADTYQRGITLARDAKGNAVPGILTAAVTDLNILARHCDAVNRTPYCASIRPKIATLQAALLRAAWPTKKPAPGAAKISNIELSAEPAGLQWRADFEGLGDDDTLAVVWYALEPEWQVWRVLPVVSGPVSPFISSRARAGSALNFDSFLSDSRTPPACVHDGQYKAQFYVNGALVASPDPITVAHGIFQPVAFGELSAAMCYPPDWQPLPMPGGLVRAFSKTPSVPRQGAYLYAYFTPFGSNQVDADLMRRLVTTSVRLALGRSLDFHAVRRCAGYFGNTRDLMGEADDGLGTMLIRSWTGADGLVYVGLVIDDGWDGRTSVERAERNSKVASSCATLVSMSQR